MSTSNDDNSLTEQRAARLAEILEREAADQARVLIDAELDAPVLAAMGAAAETDLGAVLETLKVLAGQLVRRGGSAATLIDQVTVLGQLRGNIQTLTQGILATDDAAKKV